MKKMNLFLGVLIAIVTIGSLAACKSTDEAAEPAGSDTEMEINAPEGPGAPAHPIAGVWTNPAYDGQGRSGRVVYTANADGSFNYTAYDKADGSGDAYKGKVVYKKTWKDAKGYLYGLSTVTLEYGMSWETLDRISPDGKTLEVEPGVKEINPKGPRYSIYFKK